MHIACLVIEQCYLVTLWRETHALERIPGFIGIAGKSPQLLVVTGIEHSERTVRTIQLGDIELSIRRVYFATRWHISMGTITGV
jgi:hypothetical protein